MIINKEDILKYSNESIEDYCCRLYKIKEEDFKSLSWNDIAELVNSQYYTNYSKDKFRKEYSRKVKSNIEETIDTFDGDELEEVLNSIKSERVKLNDERTQINALYRRISREDTLKDMAKIAAEEINSKLLLEPVHKINSKSERCAILQLSDIHYGIEDKTRWNEYSPEIAKLRLNKLQNKVIEYLKKENIDKLYLVILGDLIGGRIHLQLRLNSRMDVVTQAIEVSEIVSEFVNNISRYANIECYFTTDNHGRLEPNIKDAIDLESLSRITPWFMKERLKNNKNIILNTDDKYGDDIATFKIWDYNIAACHGHKDSPNQILKNISLYTKEHYDMILSSHYHHTAIDEENDTMVVYNGSVLATDSFAEKLRLNSKPSQNLIIVSKENVMECLYKINLD